MDPSFDLTEQIIAAGIEVHKALGPGLLESTYETCLCRELDLRGVKFERQVPLPVAYKGVQLESGYQLDLIVGRMVVVELKSVEKLMPIHEAQLLTYMKLSSHRIGLLMNFNVPLLRDGLKRFAL